MQRLGTTRGQVVGAGCMNGGSGPAAGCQAVNNRWSFNKAEHIEHPAQNRNRTEWGMSI